jgi:hypothetical protein
MLVLRRMMLLLAATVLCLGAVPVRAETSVDEASDAVHDCVADFARSLAHNSPLEIDAITKQSLRSCNGALKAYRQILMASPEGLSPNEVEARVLISRHQAEAVANSIAIQATSRRSSEARAAPKLDNGIWMNPGLTEEETAEARRPSLFLPARNEPSPQR